MIVLPVLLWQLWGFLAPAVGPDVQRALSVLRAGRNGALRRPGVVFCYFVILPAALDFLIGYDSNIYDKQVRASYFLSFVSLMLLVTGLAFEMPIFIIALVRLGVVTTASLRRNRRIAYTVMLVIAILLPTVDPVSLALEFIPLIILFEGSIIVASVLERRWSARGLRRVTRLVVTVRTVSADWVVPVEGDPIEDGAVVIGDDGRIEAVGAAASSARVSGSTTRSSSRGWSTPTRTWSTRCTPGSATASRSRRGS